MSSSVTSSCLIPEATGLECAICLEPLELEDSSGHRMFGLSSSGQEVEIFHLFHKTCVQESVLKTKDTQCALCRKKFLTKVQQIQLITKIETGDSSEVADLLEKFIFTQAMLKNALFAAFRQSDPNCLEVLRASRLYSSAELSDEVSRKASQG